MDNFLVFYYFKNVALNIFIFLVYLLWFAISSKHKNAIDEPWDILMFVFDIFHPFSEKVIPICASTRSTGWGVAKKHQNLFIKHYVFILPCLNFSHLQSKLHLMQYTCWTFFSTAQNSSELMDLDVFWCFCCSLFHLFHVGQKPFPLWTIFIQGN